MSGISAKARLAGLFYVPLIACGYFAEVYVRGRLVVSTDAAETAARLRAAEELFRLGLVAEIVAGALYIGVTTLLYEILRPAGRSVALHGLVFGLVGSAVFVINLIAKLVVVVLVANGPALAALAGAEGDALILASVKTHARGYQLAMIFFGCQLVLVGWLMLRARFLPRVFGVLWIVGGMTRTAYFLINFVDEGLAGATGSFLTAPGSLAEVSLALWLLVMGVNGEKWRAQAAYRPPLEGRG
jgi:Domain of unknown function (DUF4386)